MPPGRLHSRVARRGKIRPARTSLFDSSADVASLADGWRLRCPSLLVDVCRAIRFHVEDTDNSNRALVFSIEDDMLTRGGCASQVQDRSELGQAGDARGVRGKR